MLVNEMFSIKIIIIANKIQYIAQILPNDALICKKDIFYRENRPLEFVPNSDNTLKPREAKAARTNQITRSCTYK